MNDYIGNTLITEGKRATLALIILVGSFLSVNCACIYMILSWYIKASLDKQVSFLKNYYQPAAVPASMIVTGVAMLIVSLLGIKASLGGRFEEDEVEELEMNSAANFFMAFWLLALAVCVLICATAMVCFLEIYELETALNKGLKDAMLKYRTDGELKAEIDYLQMDYKCCGISNYRDWFNISWVDLQYLDLKDSEIKKRVKDGYYYSDDVPFSCCRFKLSRPCVDTRILQNSYHSNYNHEVDVTLNLDGCREAVVQFLGHVIFKSVGLFVLTCLIIWVLMTISARYLQTSIKSLSAGGQPTGWLIGMQKPKRKTSTRRGSEETEDDIEIKNDETESMTGN